MGIATLLFDELWVGRTIFGDRAKDIMQPLSAVEERDVERRSRERREAVATEGSQGGAIDGHASEREPLPEPPQRGSVASVRERLREPPCH
jgi:hypothetical protein